MKSRNSLTVLCTALAALTLTGCGLSSARPQSATAKIPGNLLAAPRAIPQPQTLPDGTQNGRLALATQLDLYDAAGEFRLWIVRLQCAVIASRGEAMRADCPRANLEK